MKKQLNLLDQLKIFKESLFDPRTPMQVKLFLLFTIIYFISPVDLFTDLIPMFGYIDDGIIAAVFIIIANRLIPQAVKDDVKKRVKS